MSTPTLNLMQKASLILAASGLAFGIGTNQVANVVTNSEIKHVRFVCENGIDTMTLKFGSINEKPAKATEYAHGGYTFETKDGETRVTLAPTESGLYVGSINGAKPKACWRS